jgi:hypothetical protein
MSDYQLTQSGNTVMRTADNAYIPIDPMNADYQNYEAWLAEGNTPDAVPAPTPDPAPTLSDLQAQLAALTAQIQAFAGGV